MNVTDALRLLRADDPGNFADWRDTDTCQDGQCPDDSGDYDGRGFRRHEWYRSPPLVP